MKTPTENTIGKCVLEVGNTKGTLTMGKKAYKMMKLWSRREHNLKTINETISKALKNNKLVNHQFTKLSEND